MATSRKTDMLCPECSSEDTGNAMHKNTYQFECGTHWIPVEFHAGPYEYRSISVACRTIKLMRAALVEARRLLLRDFDDTEMGQSMPLIDGALTLRVGSCVALAYPGSMEPCGDGTLPGESLCPMHEREKVHYDAGR